MKIINKTLFISLALVFLLSSFAFAGYSYKAKKDHLGGDITPAEAFTMVKKNSQNTFLVDCRTMPEYQFVGHAKGAYNVPLQFFSTKKIGKKGYVNVNNPNFGKDLLARFNPETDTLIIFCRSGGRSCGACNEAVKAGFSDKKVFNIMGGFEGGKNKNKNSAFYGQRWSGGWRIEGLPWTYKMDKKLMYR
ncbi:MAG: rhodanese-like domain-containing protein [Thermodesulfobacteriota bacterium]|nr:rhodanese-like domain-containing protein [Thermodesulfobacteriota bacterium]